MADIKRSISLQYQAEGLERIKKSLNELIPEGSNKELFENLSREVKELEAILGKSSDGVFDIGKADQIQKKYDKILSLFEKYRISVVKLQNEISGQESEDLDKRLLKYKKKIETLEEEKISLEKEITVLRSGEVRATQVQRKSALKSVKGDVLGSGEGARKMYSARGREMTDPFAFIKNFENIEAIFDKTNQAEAELLKKLKEGSSIAEIDLDLLQQKLEANESIKLNALEVVEKAQIRKDLLDAEQEKLIEIKELRLGEIEEEKELAKLQVEGYKQLKKQDQLEFAEGVENEEEAEIIKKTNEALETYIDLSAIADESRDELRKKIKEFVREQKEEEEAIKKTNSALKDKDNTLGKAIKNVVNYGSAYAIVRRIYKETISTIKEMDKALTNMTVVTSMSREQAWGLVGTFQDLAKQTGFTTTEIANLATEYFRQGKALKDVIELTEVAAKAARIAGISAQESMNYLTSALNGFQIAAEDAMVVSDKFAALAATSASSYEELAVGLSKFAAQAKVSGISIDFALAMLTKGVSVTREAPETIGTAIKTVLSRMRELTDFGKTLEDGMDVNRVEKALGYIGVKLRDANGEFRDMEKVLTEVGMQWDTLNATQQASVAVALAGTRQQSRLIAIMNDFQTTLDYVETSQDSAGATAYQHGQYMEGLEVAMTNLTTAWQGFTMALANSEIVVFVVNLISGALDLLVRALKAMGPVVRSLVAVFAAAIVVSKAYLVITKLNIGSTRQLIKDKLKLISTKIEEKLVDEAGVKISLKQFLVNKLNTAGIWLRNAAIKVKNFLTRKDTVLTELNTLANTKNTASVVAGTAALSGMAIVVLAIIAALALVVVGIVLLATESKRLAKAVDKASAEMYKLQKINNELREISEKITEINNKPIKIETDLEELDSLVERLQEIEEQEDVKLISRNLITGEIDWEITQQNIEAYEEKNKKERLKQAKKIAKKNKRRYRKGDITAEEYGESLAIEFVLENDLEVDQAQIDALNKLYAEAVKNGKKISKEEAKLFLEQIAKFEEEMAGAEGDIVKQLEIWKNLPDEMKEGFELAYPELAEFFRGAAGLIEEYSDTINGLGLSAEELAELAAEAQKAGISTEELLGQIEEAYEETGDWDRALAKVAQTTHEGTLKNYLYGLSMRESMLSITQSADGVASAINRINKAQEDLLAGNLSDSDFVELVDEYQDIFSDPELFEAFMRGDDVSTIAKAAEREKIYKDYENQLYAVNSQLQEYGENLSEEEKQQKALLIAEKNKILALLAMRDPLRNITYEQNKYNEALKRYQNLQALGFDSVEDQEFLLGMLQKTLYGTFKANEQSIDYFIGQLDEMGDKAEKELYKIVDGVVILTDEFYKLEGAQKETAYELIQNLQGSLDNQLQIFKEWSDQVLELEKNRVAEQKKIYEDYFKALDRLEEKRDRKQTRESIVKQLQRLEGATDERSRKKALELKKELNALDEETSRSEIEAGREALISGLDEQIEKLKATLRKAWDEFQDAITKGGENLGLAFIKILDKYEFGDYSGFLDLIEDKEKLESKIEAKQAEIDSIEGKMGSLRKEVNARIMTGTDESGNEISGNREFWKERLKEYETKEAEAWTAYEKALNDYEHKKEYWYQGRILSLFDVEEVWKNLSYGDQARYNHSFEKFMEKAVYGAAGETGLEIRKRAGERVGEQVELILAYQYQQEQTRNILREYNNIFDQEYAALKEQYEKLNEELADLNDSLDKVVEAINEWNYSIKEKEEEEKGGGAPVSDGSGVSARPVLEKTDPIDPRSNSGGIDYNSLERVLKTKPVLKNILTSDQFAKLARLQEEIAPGNGNVETNITVNVAGNATKETAYDIATEIQRVIKKTGLVTKA